LDLPEFGLFPDLPGMIESRTTSRKMREQSMTDNERAQPTDDPVIISLEEYRRTLTLPDDKPPEPTKDNDPKTNDAYWAGRSLAMRRSARWAA
jgi:hypothetical protein